MPALNVYGCSSGRVRLQISRADIVPAQASGQPFSVMAWFSDGTRLLLVPMGRENLIRVLGSRNLGS